MEGAPAIDSHAGHIEMLESMLVKSGYENREEGRERKWACYSPVPPGYCDMNGENVLLDDYGREDENTEHGDLHGCYESAALPECYDADGGNDWQGECQLADLVAAQDMSLVSSSDDCDTEDEEAERGDLLGYYENPVPPGCHGTEGGESPTSTSRARTATPANCSTHDKCQYSYLEGTALVVEGSTATVRSVSNAILPMVLVQFEDHTHDYAWVNVHAAVAAHDASATATQTPQAGAAQTINQIVFYSTLRYLDKMALILAKKLSGCSSCVNRVSEILINEHFCGSS